MRSVDIVITGDGSATLTAAVDALRRGLRVLVVLRSGEAQLARRMRRCLGRTAKPDGTQVVVMTNAEIACVDGVDGIEAVVIRYLRTGRLCAVNASAFLSCDTRQGRHVSDDDRADSGGVR